MEHETQFLKKLKKFPKNINLFVILNKHLVAQALEESGIGTIEDIKKYYTNDIIHYFKQTYSKVSKLYEEYKAKKLEKESPNLIENDLNIMQLKSENDLKLEQFMKDNDL